MLVFIKPTHECNLRCSYCSMGPQPKGRMSLVAAEAILRKIGTPDAPVSIVWHGGEPLLMGVGFYEAVGGLGRTLPNIAEQSVQTNATLLNKAFIRCFQKYGFGVGVSLDGPGPGHNSHRRFPSGRGAFGAIKRGIERLLENEVPFGVLAVPVSSHSAEMQSFLRGELFGYEGVRVEPNVPQFTDRDGCNPLRLNYDQAVRAVFDEWLATGNPVLEQTLDKPLRKLLHGDPSCQHAQLVIGWDGRVSPCSGSPTDDFGYGNILTQSWQEILAAPNRQLLLNRQSHCPDCPHAEYCSGSCPYDGIVAGDPGKPNPHCDRELLTYMQQRLQEHGVLFDEQ